MDFLVNEMKEVSQCSFDEKDVQRCPFLRNISKPTNMSFSSLNLPIPVCAFEKVIGAGGPIFEDGLNFDLAFKLFHGKDGVVPLTRRSSVDDVNDILEPEKVLTFNPLAAKTATISLSAFGPGLPFGFHSFSADKLKHQKQKSRSPEKKDHSSQTPVHEALSNDWLQTGNCPIARSYRAVHRVLPLVAKALKPPSGTKLSCPPAVVAARAALARTALARNLRPQPLPTKMLAIASLGMAANVPLGVWREHTKKFSISWFIAVHAAVPFIAMLRKAIVMPKAAMVLTVCASILGQAIGSRAEQIRLRVLAEKHAMVTVKDCDDIRECSSGYVKGNDYVRCGTQETMLSTSPSNAGETRSSGVKICF